MGEASPTEEPITDDSAPSGPTKRQSKKKMIAGIILSGLGGAGLIGGLVDYALADSLCASAGVNLSRGLCVDTYHVVGAVTAVFGGVMMAIGIPLTIVGSRRVPATTMTLVPEVRIGPAQGSLRWTF